MRVDNNQPVRSVNIFDWIDSICADFRHAWKSNQRPQIEDYLEQVPPQARANLLQNLVQLDLRYRRRLQETPRSDEYCARFPEFAKHIRRAFDESTVASLHGAAGTSQNVVAARQLPAANRLGDYELLHELGRGGFGVVYEARHLQRHDRVALKTLPTGLEDSASSLNNAERLHKFRQEFRKLSEVNHPHLVGMQTLEVDAGQWFLTMDLVQGVDFLQYVRPQNQLDETRLRAILKQLLQGIHALHGWGIVHCDLKPSNVMVDQQGNVKILDFGLIAELQQCPEQTVSIGSQQFAGTPRYAAPEQLEGIRTSATDWYAMGVMLYEALTGETPFSGTAVEMLLKKQTEDAPLLNDVDLPHDLAQLANQLLQRKPQQRPDAQALAQAFATTLDVGSRDGTDSRLSGNSLPLAELLVGREPQLEQLTHAHRMLLTQREPIVVFISGLSGEGKTTLAEAFWRRCDLIERQLCWPGDVTIGNRFPSRLWTVLSTRWWSFYWPCPTRNDCE